MKDMIIVDAIKQEIMNDLEMVRRARSSLDGIREDLKQDWSNIREEAQFIRDEITKEIKKGLVYVKFFTSCFHSHSTDNDKKKNKKNKKTASLKLKNAGDDEYNQLVDEKQVTAIEDFSQISIKEVLPNSNQVTIQS